MVYSDCVCISHINGYQLSWGNAKKVNDLHTSTQLSCYQCQIKSFIFFFNVSIRLQVLMTLCKQPRERGQTIHVSNQNMSFVIFKQ